jgi:hypothetical protein
MSSRFGMLYKEKYGNNTYIWQQLIHMAIWQYGNMYGNMAKI